jgi:hypothetical protein
MPRQIAETLFPPIEIKAEETIASDYFIPDLPRGSGLICGGLEPKARSDVRDEEGETASPFPRVSGPAE